MTTTAADILGSKREPKVPAKWRKHYQQLCAERERLSARDFSGSETASVKMDDLTDAGAEESARGVFLVTAGATQAIISEVVDAIQRIERGTYGICEITGKPIEEERLEAIPWTRHSMPGQNEAEKSGFGKKLALPPLESVTQPDAVAEGEGESEEESPS